MSTSTSTPRTPSQREYREIICAALVLASVLIVYVASPVITSIDSFWTIQTALSIIHKGNAKVDDFMVMREQYDNRLDEVDGNLYNRYPIAVSVMAVPFVWAAELVKPDLYVSMQTHPRRADDFALSLEMWIASFYTALAALLIFFIARFQLTRPFALVAALVFAFATSAWTTASRALWQHGPSMLMLALVLYILLCARDRPRLIVLAAVPLAISFWIRPTNSIAVIAFSIYVLKYYRQYLTGYFITGLIVTLPFVWYDLTLYHALLPEYFNSARLGNTPFFWEALAGNLVSPARGLFIFSPVLLFAVVGAWEHWRTKRWSGLDTALLAIIAGHWLMISSYPHWWAGASFGPRYMSDILPFFMYFFIYALKWLGQAKRARKLVASTALLLLLVTSVAIEWNGAVHFAAYAWNWNPVNVDDYKARLWDWGDPQFLRGSPFTNYYARFEAHCMKKSSDIFSRQVCGLLLHSSPD